MQTSAKKLAEYNLFRKHLSNNVYTKLSRNCFNLRITLFILNEMLHLIALCCFLIGSLGLLKAWIVFWIFRESFLMLRHLCRLMCLISKWNKSLDWKEEKTKQLSTWECQWMRLSLCDWGFWDGSLMTLILCTVDWWLSSCPRSNWIAPAVDRKHYTC